MSNSSAKIAVYGDSREALALRDALRRAGALGSGAGAALHVVAAHPFASDLPRHAAGYSPLVYLRRPGWQETALDDWHRVQSPEAAADWLAQMRPGPALVALGRARLAPFYRLANQILFIRSRSLPHPAAPRLGALWTDPGPFGLADETARFAALGVSVVIAHDAGGLGGWAKLEAARALGLPVVLLARPTWPDGPLFEDIATLSAHIHARLGLDLGTQGA